MDYRNKKGAEVAKGPCTEMVKVHLAMSCGPAELNSISTCLKWPTDMAAARSSLPPLHIDGGGQQGQLDFGR